MSGFWKRTKGTSSHSTSATAAEEGKPVVHSRRRSKKLIFIIVGVIAVLAVGGYLLFVFVFKKEAPEAPAPRTEQNAIQDSIEQYKNQAKTADEHLLVASLYMGDQKYQAAVDEIEKAYEASRDVSVLGRQSIILMDNLQDKGSERLRRNISALSGKSNLPPETTYRIAQLLEGTELASDAKKFYQLTLDNFSKVTKDSVITKKELRAKIGEN